MDVFSSWDINYSRLQTAHGDSCVDLDLRKRLVVDEAIVFRFNIWSTSVHEVLLSGNRAWRNPMLIQHDAFSIIPEFAETLVNRQVAGGRAVSFSLPAPGSFYYVLHYCITHRRAQHKCDTREILTV